MVKKKITYELEIYFPNDFISSKEKETYDRLKRRTLLVLDSIINDLDNSVDINTIDNTMLNLYSPKLYTGPESVEVQYDKSFENTCILIAQKVNLDAKKMTVLQFYSAINSIKLQAEIESKSIKQHKRK